MGTVKWHLLDHVADDIVRNGGSFLCDGGIYEHSHTISNHSRAKKSIRRSTEMDDSIEMVRRRISEDVHTTKWKWKKNNEMDETEQ